VSFLLEKIPEGDRISHIPMSLRTAQDLPAWALSRELAELRDALLVRPSGYLVQLKSGVAIGVARALREIPFPQRDLHLRSSDISLFGAIDLPKIPFSRKDMRKRRKAVRR
jgi:hypothetical protein